MLVGKIISNFNRLSENAGKSGVKDIEDQFRSGAKEAPSPSPESCTYGYIIDYALMRNRILEEEDLSPDRFLDEFHKTDIPEEHLSGLKETLKSLDLTGIDVEQIFAE